MTVIAALVVLAVVFATSKASLDAGGDGLAQISMPLGGGTVESVSVTTTGAHAHKVPVSVVGDPQIVPSGKIDAGRTLDVTVVVKRPGWLSWLTGSTETLHTTTTTPVADVSSRYLTVHGGSGTPLTVSFKTPVSSVSYGTAGHMTTRALASPQTQVTIPRPAPAGTELISARVHPWERSKSTSFTWFPAGGHASAIASPKPGATISASTPITLSFNTSVAKALNGHMPAVSPAGAGNWKRLSSHAIEFVPSGYGYGLGANVQVSLPSGVNLVGGHQANGAEIGGWSVPVGSTMRLQELLSMTGYLPFKFRYADGKGIADTPLAQEEAATKPPQGSFDWRYPNVPGQLRALWAPGGDGTMTKGAVMAFENAHDMTADGVAGADVWRALIGDVDANRSSNFGYTFVSVSEASSESEATWHDGKTVVSGPVNTGVASAPTAQGVFPVFEHVPVTTMTGTNPDGSHYSDPGIQWVSYFNGGDALHEFPRGSYGFPQSDGCVEMPLGEAASVYPYTPIGTLVDVS